MGEQGSSSTLLGAGRSQMRAVTGKRKREQPMLESANGGWAMKPGLDLGRLAGGQKETG